MLTPTCAYRVDAELVEALDAVLGPPLDSYVRGWQVWLEPDGPDGATLEWRLHPPARFRMPRGVDPHDLFGEVLQGLAAAEPPREQHPLELGAATLPLSRVWEVLEVFPTYGEDVDPEVLAAAAANRLSGRWPDVAGRVDHARMGDEWKSRSGGYSVGEVLLTSLPAPRRGAADPSAEGEEQP